MVATAFCLEIRLVSAVVTNGFLTLDSLLAAALYNRTGDLAVAHRDIPLQREHEVWRGSTVFFSEPCFIVDVDRVASLKQRDDLSLGLYAPGPRGFTAIDQRRGRYKASLDGYKGMSAEYAYYFGMGDAEASRELIARWLPGLGKKHQSGCGEFESIVVRELAVDRSWSSAGGTPTRPIPVETWMAIGGRTDVATEDTAWMPPYSPSSSLWTADSVRRCVIPVERCVDAVGWCEREDADRNDQDDADGEDW